MGAESKDRDKLCYPHEMKAIRLQSGQNQLEFTAVFCVLILFILLPLIDLSAVPVRMGLAQANIKDAVTRLSKSEKFSDAKKNVGKDSDLAKRLAILGGVTVREMTLSLRMSKASDSTNKTIASEPGQLPDSWLPDGANCPCLAELVLSVHADVSPLILSPNMGVEIPGLTKPFPMKFEETSPWENLGRDPQGGKYYLNE